MLGQSQRLDPPPPDATSPLSCSSSCADHSSRTCEGLRLLWYLHRHWKAVRRGARWRCPEEASPSFSASWQAMFCQSWSLFASATRLSFANSSRVHSLWRTPGCSWLVHLAGDSVAGQGGFGVQSPEFRVQDRRVRVSRFSGFRV